MSRALLVIDVQESFRHTPLWPAASNPQLVEKVNRLVGHSREHGDLLVWVLHSEPGSGGPFDPVNGLITFLPGLTRPRSGEPVLVKTAHNVAGGATVETAARACGFADARMLRRLRARERLTAPG